MDLSNQIVNALVNNWPLVAGMGVIGWKTLPWAIKVGLDKYFSNGGGEKLRQIVKEENAVQSVAHKEELDRRLHEHEVRQEERFKAGEARFQQIEATIDDLTDGRGRPLERRRRRTR